MPSDLIRGWIPVRVKKTRQNKRFELGSDSSRTGKAPGLLIPKFANGGAIGSQLAAGLLRLAIRRRIKPARGGAIPHWTVLAARANH
jgi:hypothetical protein